MSGYPLHESWRAATDKDLAKANEPIGGEQSIREVSGKKMARACAGTLVLPEHVGLSAEGALLYCLGCDRMVPPEPGQREQAEAAAIDEQARAVTRGELQPGALSAVSRRVLAEWPKHFHAKCVEPGERAAIADLTGLGLADAHGDLTDHGELLRAKILRPKVPIHALKFDPAHAPKHVKCKKARAKKSKPVAPAAPMVCVCGHGPRAHVDDKANDCPCTGNDGACGCKRYKQAKAAPEAPAA